MRAHELQVAGGAERQVEAVEQPVDDVVEQRTLARRLGVVGRRLPGLEVVADRERHAAAQAVGRVADRHAHHAGDPDAPTGTRGKALGNGNPDVLGRNPGTACMVIGSTPWAARWHAARRRRYGRTSYGEVRIQFGAS